MPVGDCRRVLGAARLAEDMGVKSETSAIVESAVATSNN